MKKDNVLKFVNTFRVCIATYEYNGFLIELFHENEEVECWLRHPDYGIALFVVGVKVDDDYIRGAINFFEEFVSSEIEAYIAHYIDKFAQELEQ
ncbi:MAG: hypothetical protein IJX99_00255 [Clostridia bacterium]|nr:hypothetical protein [Clostridia bacterium]